MVVYVFLTFSKLSVFSCKKNKKLEYYTTCKKIYVFRRDSWKSYTNWFSTLNIFKSERILKEHVHIKTFWKHSYLFSIYTTQTQTIFKFLAHDFALTRILTFITLFKEFSRIWEIMHVKIVITFINIFI